MLKTGRNIFGLKAGRLYFCTPKSERKKEQVDLVAQLVEQYTFNVWALGSSPSGITKKPLIFQGFLLFHPGLVLPKAC